MFSLLRENENQGKDAFLERHPLPTVVPAGSRALCARQPGHCLETGLLALPPAALRLFPLWKHPPELDEGHGEPARAECGRCLTWYAVLIELQIYGRLRTPCLSHSAAAPAQR